MKAFIYRGFEIHARVWDSFCDTYAIDEQGNPTRSMHKRTSNHEMQVLWYEFSAVSPETGKLTEYKGEEWYSFKDVKEMIDRSIEFIEKRNKKTHKVRSSSVKQLVTV